MNLVKSILFVGLVFATCSSVLYAQSSNVKKAKTNIVKFEGLKNTGALDLIKPSLTAAQEAIDLAVVHEKTKEDPEAWTYYSLVYANLAKIDSSADAASKAEAGLKKAKELDTEKKHAENLDIAGQTLGQFKFNQAVKAWDSQNYKVAYDEFNGALNYLPGDTTLTFYAGLAAYHNKDYDNAIAKYKELVPLKDYSSHKSIMLNLPRIYNEKGDTEAALAAAKEAVAAYPNDNEAAVLNIELNLIAGKEAEVIKDIQAQVEKDPQNKNLLYYLGLAYGSSGDNVKALESYQKVLAIDPNHKEANNNSAVVIMNAGRDELLALNEDKAISTPDYNKKVAELKTKIGKALPYLIKATELDPTNKDAFKNLKNYYDFVEDEAKSAETQAKMDAITN